MDRREAIKRTALLSGLALSASTLGSIVQGCQPDAPDWQPAFFDPAQFEQVSAMAETILPATEDMPGATDLLVHRFIDGVVGQCYDMEDRQRFVAGLTEIDGDSRETYGNAFADCSSEEQLALLNEWDREAKTFVKENPDEKEGPFPAFLAFKQLTLMGFFTSKRINTEVLNYDPIPGGYEGCIPLERTDGKIWATNKI